MNRGFPWVSSLLFVIAGATFASYAVQAVETDLEVHARSALLAQDLPTDRVTFSGRDAWLAASLAAEPAYERARAVVARVPGVRAVFRYTNPDGVGRGGRLGQPDDGSGRMQDSQQSGSGRS